MKIRFLTLALAAFLSLAARGADNGDWQEALAASKSPTNRFTIFRTEPVDLLLANFKPHGEVRGIILMPGAADALYFFNRGSMSLRDNPTLLDVLRAITNKTKLQVTYEKPFILLHADADKLVDPLKVSDEAITKVKMPHRTYFLDRAYDRVLPEFEKLLRRKILPDQNDHASWHFYRLAFVGYDLTGPELLRAMAYTMRTLVEAHKDKIVFRDHPRPAPSP